MAPLALRAQAPAPSGTVLTIAGNGLAGFSGDGGRIRYVVPDSINLTNDSQQTAFYLPWISMGLLTGVSDDLDISGNTSAAAIDLGSLTTASGNLDISGNTSAAAIDLGSHR